MHGFVFSRHLSLFVRSETLERKVILVWENEVLFSFSYGGGTYFKPKNIMISSSAQYCNSMTLVKCHLLMRSLNATWRFPVFIKEATCVQITLENDWKSICFWKLKREKLRTIPKAKHLSETFSTHFGNWSSSFKSRRDCQWALQVKLLSHFDK